MFYINLHFLIIFYKLFLLFVKKRGIKENGIFQKGGNMSKAIRFFNVFITKNGEITNLSTYELLNKIYNVERVQRFRRINNEPVILQKSYYFEQTNLSAFTFAKYRIDYKPFAGNIENDVMKKIDDDVIETTNMVFDYLSNLAILDSNMYGLREKSIEEYLSTFMTDEIGEKWEIKFYPIKESITLNDIKNSDLIKYIEIKLKVSNSLSLKKNESVDDGFFSGILDLFVSSNEIEGNLLSLKFETSKIKFGMNTEAIFNILNLMNLESSNIESINIRYKKGKDYTIVDLKNLDNQIKTRILEDSPDKNPAPEFIISRMIEKYESSFRARLSTRYIEYNLETREITSSFIFKSVANTEYLISNE